MERLGVVAVLAGVADSSIRFLVGFIHVAFSIESQIYEVRARVCVCVGGGGYLLL